MKSFILSTLILFSASISNAQEKNLTPVVQQYLALKDALVDGKAANVQIEATKLISSINSVDDTKLQADFKSTWSREKSTLLKSAEDISTAKNIDKQREAFATLSTTLWPLLKSQKPTEKLFYDYCPMKKSYWISSEEIIKNPYYGASMLGCGKVVEKIN